jgi:hypothetical protein
MRMSAQRSAVVKPDNRRAETRAVSMGQDPSRIRAARQLVAWPLVCSRCCRAGAAGRRLLADAGVCSERARGSRAVGTGFPVRGWLSPGLPRGLWLLAWLRPLIVRGRPSTVNGAAHLFQAAKSVPPEKDGPAGRH